MHSKVWDEITYPYQNFTIEVWEWKSDSRQTQTQTQTDGRIEYMSKRLPVTGSWIHKHTDT